MRKGRMAGMACLLAITLFGCAGRPSVENVLTVETLHNGDAKFAGDWIVTNVDGSLNVLDLEGGRREYDVRCNWIDTLGDDVLVYGNGEKEIGIVTFDDQMNVEEQYVLWSGERLMIDPAILSVGADYWLTVTEIEGAVNNAEKEGENGRYTIRLYRSRNLKDWEYVTDVASCENNLEDVKLFDQGAGLGVLYEKETVDKGDSGIYVRVMPYPRDGESSAFGEERELLEPDCDHEPAGLLKQGDGYVLFYSCDRENRGASYQGSSVYYARYDLDFRAERKDVKVEVPGEDGQLLYDVRWTSEGVDYLTSVNYLTDCSLAVWHGKKLPG